MINYLAYMTNRPLRNGIFGIFNTGVTVLQAFVLIIYTHVSTVFGLLQVLRRFTM